jgi:hypothetical protein
LLARKSDEAASVYMDQFFLTETEKAQDYQHNHDKADDPNDVVHHG